MTDMQPKEYINVLRLVYVWTLSVIREWTEDENQT